MIDRRSLIWLIAAFTFALLQTSEIVQRSFVLGTLSLLCMVLCFIGMLVAMESVKP